MFKEHLVFIHIKLSISAPISRPVVSRHPIATFDSEPIKEVNLEAS